MSWPSSYDNIASVASGATITSTLENQQINAINALEATLGLTPNAPFSSVAAATAAIATKVNRAGDSMSGNLSMGNNRITGLGSPVNPGDSATKGYVDGLSAAPSSYPWQVNVDVFATAISYINWDNISADTNQLNGFVKLSSGSQNDEINFDLVLAAGTWTFELLHAKAANFGIYSVQINGVEKGTIDGYSGSSINNARSQVTGILIGTTAKVRLKLKMTSKNASSSAYYGYISNVQMTRTA